MTHQVNPDEIIVSEVLAAEQERCRAVEQRDWEALGTVIADDFVYTHSNGKHESKDEWLSGIRTLDRAIVHDDLEVRAFGDVAILSGGSVNRYAEPFDGDSHFGSVLDVLQVWVKQGGSWRIIAQHGVKDQLRTTSFAEYS